MAHQWFRLYSEFASDHKMQMMSEAYQRRYVMLLCLRCSNGDVTLHDNEVAFQLRVTPEEWAQTKIAFIDRNLIDNDNKVLAWDRRQFVSDSSAERVARHRERKKQECNVTVTPPDTDTDTDTEENKKKVKRKVDVDCPGGVSPSTWSDFLQIRKAKKAPVTQAALNGIVREASKAGWTLEKALIECCARGWTGFKAEWVQKDQGNRTEHQKRQDATARALFGNMFETPSMKTIEGEVINENTPRLLG